MIMLLPNVRQPAAYCCDDWVAAACVGAGVAVQGCWGISQDDDMGCGSVLHRCRAEARYSSNAGAGSSSSSGGGGGSSRLSQLLADVYSSCQSLEPQLDVAVEAEDLPRLAELQQQLQEMQLQLEGAIRQAQPPANVRRWLQVNKIVSSAAAWSSLSLCHWWLCGGRDHKVKVDLFLGSS
jgi:hypothetical protein